MSTPGAGSREPIRFPLPSHGGPVLKGANCDTRYRRANGTSGLSLGDAGSPRVAPAPARGRAHSQWTTTAHLMRQIVLPLPNRATG